MAESDFTLRVHSPQGTVFDGPVKSVTLPTPEGEITVLAHHMPLVAALAAGEMRVRAGEKIISIAIAGGFIEAGGNAATVLSDFAAEAESIEIARVEEAKRRAEALLKEKTERRDLALVERDLQRAILQLKVAEKVRKRRQSLGEPR
jgi:F-type H+-transporting ATPase subunit epsilon